MKDSLQASSELPSTLLSLFIVIGDARRPRWDLKNKTYGTRKGRLQYGYPLYDGLGTRRHTDKVVALRQLIVRLEDMALVA